jgi:transposase InsO family protein
VDSGPGNRAALKFHRTLKQILRLSTMQEDQAQFEREVDLAIAWYNEHRPHETLGGKTPNEVHFTRSVRRSFLRFSETR